MLSRTKRELRAVDDKIKEIAEKATEIIETANKESRSRTDDENAEVAEFHKALETLRENRRELEDRVALEEGVQNAVKDIKPDESGVPLKDGANSIQDAMKVKSVGEQFVESEGYQRLLGQIKGQGAGMQFSTGKVEVKAGTLLEGGQGAGLIPVPQVVPGQVETLFERLTVADLLPTGQATTNSLRYVVEGTATAGATAVEEGGAKPASDLALSTVDEPVQKIATILTVSDEMLEDAAAVSSYINGRLALFVKIEEEDQLLNGSGTAPNISGFFDRAINTKAAGTVDDNAVALFKALNGTRGSSFLEPDTILMGPDTWQATRLLQDLNGQFYGGGPFTSAYAGPQGPEASSYPDNNSLWGKRVVVTSAIGSGTALLGSFRQGAQLFRRGGLTVEATNSHASYFTSNLVAIRAEERLALAVYRPSAFTNVTGLDT